MSRRAALLTTVLFAPQWLCANTLLWRSNFSTLHGALATLALCLLFLCYLDSGAAVGTLRRLRTARAGFARQGDRGERAPAPRRALGLASAAVRREARFSSVVRRRGVPPRAVRRDHGPLPRLPPFLRPRCLPGIRRPVLSLRVPLAGGTSQTLFSFNYALLSFSHHPFFLPRAPWPRATLQAGLRYPLIMPMALTAVAGWRRDQTLALACCWIFLTLIPTAWLDTYRMDRFFYLPMVGVSLIMAHGLESWWQAGRSNALPRRALRLASPLILAYLTAVNLISTGSLCLQARTDSDRLASAFQALRAGAGHVPRGTLVILRNAPGEFFAAGLGVNEMVRVSLGDPQAVGINEGQPLSPRWANRVKQIRSVYWLDFERCPPCWSPLCKRRCGHNQIGEASSGGAGRLGPSGPGNQLLARSTQGGVTLGLVYLLIVNLSMITLSALRYRDESDLIFAAYSTLRKQSGQIPRGSLLVMRNIPGGLFVNGIGLPDMVRVALGDPTAQAAIEGEIMPYHWLARLHRIPS